MTLWQKVESGNFAYPFSVVDESTWQPAYFGGVPSKSVLKGAGYFESG